MKRHFLFLPLAFVTLISCSNLSAEEPIELRTMGSFLFGGTVTPTADGATFHGDHGYAQYFIPTKSHTYPIVMWHGIGQSGRSYETTPDGREGYMAILPRRNWSVYIIDQPRRGRAGYTTSKVHTRFSPPTILSERAVWEAFRNGTWPEGADKTFYDTLLFPKDPASVDQFFRQQTPDTGAEPRTKEHRDFMGQTMAELLDQTGPAILITHSNSGQYGWATAITDPESVKAIVAYEPGACAFPQSDCPTDLELSEITLCNETQAPQIVSDGDFQKLTKIPIVIVFGDNIATEKSGSFNGEVWRIAKHRARQFVETINRHGGDAALLALPEIGIRGNTHAPFADLNNLEIVGLLEQFLQEKGLAGYDNPHTGPKIIK